MPCLKYVLWLVVFAVYTMAHFFPTTNEDTYITEACNQQTRACALKLRYSKCAHVKSRESECSLRNVCSKAEFQNLFDLACRGEELLASLAHKLDPACVKKLESPECEMGFQPMTIFDYGNLSTQYHLCDKVQASPIAKCLAGNVEYNIPDCTQKQYQTVVNTLCAVSSQANYAMRLDTCLFFVLFWACVSFMISVSLLMPHLLITEFEALVVLR